MALVRRLRSSISENQEDTAETPVLAYFDPGKEVVVQLDSSKDGIGAVLF